MSDNVRQYVIPRLEDYDISEKVGFLQPDPLNELPSYFQPWTDLAKNVTALLDNKTLRQRVHEMPFLKDYDSHLASDEKQKHKQLCLAYVYLTFIGAGYVWQDENNLAKDIPKQLAFPWYHISHTLGFKPVSCMASVALNNYQLKDPEGSFSLENLEVICQFPESRWFLLVTIKVEEDAVKGIKAIVKAMEAVRDGSDDDLFKALSDIKDSLDQITATSKRMREHMKGDSFYNVVRKYLSGYGGNSAKIPNGLNFVGVTEIPQQAIGGSAAQSSTIQSFDNALGIKHADDKQGYLTEVRSYMPLKHRAFIEALAQGPSIKDYVKCKGDERTKEMYDSAVEALRKFRDYHMQLVSRYILKPAQNNQGERGTGGTEIIPFLTSIRNSTVGLSEAAATATAE